MNATVEKTELDTKARTRFGWRFGYLIASFGIYMVDQTTKAWAVRTLRFQGDRTIVQGFFELVYTENPGIAGNLTDRARLGYVIDFIVLHAHSYHWPTFNVADASITIGALLLAFDLLFEKKQKNSVVSSP